MLIWLSYKNTLKVSKHWSAYQKVQLHVESIFFLVVYKQDYLT